ncbi:hypothetical protein HDU84_006174 [Entophlyctis sp. JEL0112]|nr:hypothetical protein HDU84_006174 [Entophlyctis sp. JEL0112]
MGQILLDNGVSMQTLEFTGITVVLFPQFRAVLTTLNSDMLILYELATLPHVLFTPDCTTVSSHPATFWSMQTGVETFKLLDENDANAGFKSKS